MGFWASFAIRHIRGYGKLRRTEHFQTLLPTGLLQAPKFEQFRLLALSRPFVGFFHPKPFIFAFMHRSLGWLLFRLFISYPSKLCFRANRTKLLGGSWVVTAGVISPLWIIAIVTLLISPPMTTHELPSTSIYALKIDCQLLAFNPAFLQRVVPFYPYCK